MKNGIMPQISYLHLTWKRYLEAPLLKGGVTIKQFYLLRKLKEKGVLYPAEIAEILFCDRPTASVVISNMEKKSWITRERDKGDKRKWLIRLSVPGEEAFALYRGKMNPLEIDPTGGLDDEEIRQLDKLLGKIRKNLEEQL